LESAAEDDSVGFDFQILHQSAAPGEEAGFGLLGERRTSLACRRSDPLSQTERDGYHLGAAAFRVNMIA
jgi:hypothetical protein